MSNMTVTALQEADAWTKARGVTASLNRAFWGQNSDTSHAIVMGSWGKRSHVRPPRDIDLLFLLPAEIYHRYQDRGGNRQSQLLQDLRSELRTTYPNTDMRGDGQVIVIPFASISVEVAPGFECTDGSIIVVDTNNGGRYRTSTALAESSSLDVIDAQFGGNARALIRMAKVWQNERLVDIKSFQIERLVCEFLPSCPWRNHDVFYFDWLVRDFFKYICGRANGSISMPGTGELIPLGGSWFYKARVAEQRAAAACAAEQSNDNAGAGGHWQSIFGIKIPLIA